MPALRSIVIYCLRSGVAGWPESLPPTSFLIQDGISLSLQRLKAPYHFLDELSSCLDARFRLFTADFGKAIIAFRSVLESVSKQMEKPIRYLPWFHKLLMKRSDDS